MYGMVELGTAPRECDGAGRYPGVGGAGLILLEQLREGDRIGTGPRIDNVLVYKTRIWGRETESWSFGAR